MEKKLTLQQLVRRVLLVGRRTDENGDSPLCAICYGHMECPHDLEPTPICNTCAQDAAQRLASFVRYKVWRSKSKKRASSTARSA